MSVTPLIAAATRPAAASRAAGVEAGRAPRSRHVRRLERVALGRQCEAAAGLADGVQPRRTIYYSPPPRPPPGPVWRRLRVPLRPAGEQGGQFVPVDPHAIEVALASAWRGRRRRSTCPAFNSSTPRSSSTGRLQRRPAAEVAAAERRRNSLRPRVLRRRVRPRRRRLRRRGRRPTWAAVGGFGPGETPCGNGLGGPANARSPRPPPGGGGPAAGG